MIERGCVGQKLVSRGVAYDMDVVPSAASPLSLGVARAIRRRYIGGAAAEIAG